jgi:hypothetical protein
MNEASKIAAKISRDARSNFDFSRKAARNRGICRANVRRDLKSFASGNFSQATPQLSMKNLNV